MNKRIEGFAPLGLGNGGGSISTRGHEMGNQHHPEGLAPMQETLIDNIVAIGAFKTGEFRLKAHERFPEAPLDPIYIDLRLLQGNFLAKQAAVSEYIPMMNELTFDLIAGVPTAAIALASSVADEYAVGLLSPRLDSKTHGISTKVDGLVPSNIGKKTVLLDDLVTNADSKIEAANILRNAGVKVTDVVVLIDREQGGREQLQKHGLELHASFTVSQMLDYMVRKGKMTKEELERIKTQMAAFTEYMASKSSETSETP